MGLPYLTLGQSPTTLSEGECQRLKLARELLKAPAGRSLYLLDEPTRGLHPKDVEHFLILLDRLVDAGNTRKRRGSFLFLRKASICYRKLLDGLSLFPLLKIDFAAQIIFFKNRFCRLLISVHLPAT